MTAVDDHVAGNGSKPNPNGRIKRDQWGRYMIPDPVTGDEKAWTRATTLAGTLEDRYGLEQWDARNVVLGIGARSDLYAKAAAATADDVGDLNTIIREAKQASKSSAGANLGTAVHRFTERIDAGEISPADVPVEWRPDVEAYAATMRANELLVVPGWLERVLIVPELSVAGTVDRLLQHLSAWQRLRIGDLKTGKVEQGWLKIAIQLAIYANASHWYDPVAGELHPIVEDIDRERAVVMHLPVGQATCTLYEVDIAFGWEAAQVAYDVRERRKRKDIATAFGTPVAVTHGNANGGAGGGEGAAPPVTGAPSPPTTAVPSEDERAAEHNRRLASTFGLAIPAGVPGHVSPPASPERVAWLRQRVAVIYGEGHSDQLERRWRVDVCPAPIGEGYTDEQVSIAAAWCDEVEGVFGIPFGATDPLIVEAFDEAAAQAAEAADAAEPAPPAPDPNADAQHWTAEARKRLRDFTGEEVLAIAQVAGMSKDDSRMTEQRYRHIEALVTELADEVDGAVVLQYGPDGPFVAPSPHAITAMEVACTGPDGKRLGRSAALMRAKTLARDLGLPVPRGLAKAAEQPLLAALVAAGHGAPTPNSEDTAK